MKNHKPFLTFTNFEKKKINGVHEWIQWQSCKVRPGITKGHEDFIEFYIFRKANQLRFTSPSVLENTDIRQRLIKKTRDQLGSYQIEGRCMYDTIMPRFKKLTLLNNDRAVVKLSAQLILQYLLIFSIDSYN